MSKSKHSIVPSLRLTAVITRTCAAAATFAVKADRTGLVAIQTTDLRGTGSGLRPVNNSTTTAVRRPGHENDRRDERQPDV